MPSTTPSTNPNHRPSFYAAKSLGGGVLRTDIECSCKLWKGYGTANTKAGSREDAYRAHNEHVTPTPTPGDEKAGCAIVLVLGAAVISFVVWVVISIGSAVGGSDDDSSIVYDEVECSALQGSIKNEKNFTQSETRDMVYEFKSNC